MRIAVGKVVSGKVVLEGEPLADGTKVAVLAGDTDDQGFDVSPEQKRSLLTSIAQADRGEVFDAAEVLRRLAR
jgi:hypothetical protein